MSTSLKSALTTTDNQSALGTTGNPIIRIGRDLVHERQPCEKFSLEALKFNLWGRVTANHLL